MALVIDVDGLDLWVEPHEWTGEERDEVRRFIEARRQRETSPQFAKTAVQILAKRRAVEHSPPPTDLKFEPADGSDKI